MMYGKIDTIDHATLEILQQKIAAHEGTTTDILRVDKLFFNNPFRDEVEPEIKAEVWDNGPTRAAHAMRAYRRSACIMKTKLPDVCARIDDILTSVCNPVEAVDAAFANYLDSDAIKAI